MGSRFFHFHWKCGEKHVALGAAGSLTDTMKRDPEEEQSLEMEGHRREEKRKEGRKTERESRSHIFL